MSENVKNNAAAEEAAALAELRNLAVTGQTSCDNLREAINRWEQLRNYSGTPLDFEIMAAGTPGRGGVFRLNSDFIPESVREDVVSALAQQSSHAILTCMAKVKAVANSLAEYIEELENEQRATEQVEHG